MDLIALRDFRNVPALRLKQADKDGVEKTTLKDAIHDDHIHKGAIFSIGTAKTADRCTQEEKMLIGELLYTGAAAPASDEKIVKLVREDVEIEKKRLANAAKLDAATSNSALVKHLTDLIKGGAKAATA